MKKITLFIFCLSTASFLSAQIIHDNGVVAGGTGFAGLVTPGATGFGGAPASVLQGTSTSLGAGHQILSANRVADDFTLLGITSIDSLKFFAYQTGSPTTSTINDVRVRIFDGPPNAGGVVIYGDTTTNRLSSTSWTGIYRTGSTTPTDANRPIMTVKVNISPALSLPAGTYWIEWNCGGTLASGPWAPVLNHNVAFGAGNAIQRLGTTFTWSPLMDGGSTLQMGLPFIVYGNTCNTTAVDIQNTCNSYTWIDGNTYTSNNNTATHVIPNASGCDSTITLNLTIAANTSGTDTQIACNSYTWIDGNTYTMNNNTATHLLSNAAGCDSLVTLNLTMNIATSGTDTQAACDSYTWIDGNTYTSSNSTATHLLTSANGCDSLVTLNLTMNNSSSVTDTQVECDSYTWINGTTYTASNSTATHLLSSAAGCDSLVTLNLTMNYSTIGTITETALDIYTAPSGATYTSSGVYTDVIPNAAGCDSTITINLTVNYSGIDELDKFDLSLYPNPTSGVLHIDGIENLNEIYALTITSVSGTIVGRYDQIEDQIDVSNLVIGVYFVHIRAANGSGTLRFVKE